MKKDVYVLVGIGALVLTLVLGASWIYKRSQKPASEAPPSTIQALLNGVDSPTLGPATARVRITEFLDPECEACGGMHPYVKAILKEYEGRIHYTIRYMPFHHNSVYAASMLEASREQGKYWEALDALFERQAEWADHHTPKPELIPTILGGIGLNVAKLEQDAKKTEIKSRIERDESDGKAVGVRATPTFFVNEKVLMELSVRQLRAMVEQELGIP